MLLFLTLFGSVYIGIQLLLWYIWNRTANISININDIPDTSITVLIPIRNEENYIAECIDSVLKQSYSGDRFEILVIDDHSSDKSAAIVSQYPQVQYYKLENELTGKKSAIQKGVELANGEVILTLDGDCRVGENWMINMVGGLIGMSADIVTGPVALQEKDATNFVQKYQIVEQAAMNIITCTGIKSRMFFTSNGANMGFYKKTFLALNPYEANQHIVSGDDVFMIHKAVAEGKDVAYIKAKKAIVYTQAKASFDAFLDQRLRWSSKATAYQHLGTKWYLRSYLIHILIFLLLVLLSIALPSARTFLFYFILAKSIVDYLLMKSGLWWSGQDLKTKDILLSTYFQVFYTLFLVYKMTQNKNFIWKGRPISSKIQKSP